jgi:heterodisulfide reductase subunit B
MLDVQLQELEDWSCCGATPAHAVNHELALLLPARNLLLAQGQGKDLLVPCAACYGRSRAAQIDLEQHDEARRKVEETFGQGYRGQFQILSLLDLLSSGPILDQMERNVINPLRGLRVACYYGCLLVRPPRVTGVADYEWPHRMDQVVEVLGGEAVEWSYKTDCCGGSLIIPRPDIAIRLIARILQAAQEAGAECLATACPMCLSNLDTRQQEVSMATGNSYRIPIFYITELIALALGYPRTYTWWRKHLVDPRPVLQARQLMA